MLGEHFPWLLIAYNEQAERCVRHYCTCLWWVCARAHVKPNKTGKNNKLTTNNCQNKRLQLIYWMNIIIYWSWPSPAEGNALPPSLSIVYSYTQLHSHTHAQRGWRCCVTRWKSWLADSASTNYVYVQPKCVFIYLWRNKNILRGTNLTLDLHYVFIRD